MFSSRVSKFRSRSVGRALLVVALLLAVGTAGISQESTGWWGSYYMPGNFIGMVDVGLGSYAGSASIDLSGGAEFIVTKFRPADLFAIDIGLSARGIFSLWRPPLAGRGYAAFGGGVSPVAHFGFRGFDFPFAEYLERLDVFASVGLGFLGYGLSGDWTGISEPNGGLRFISSNGFNYFLTDSISVSLVYTYWGDWSSASIGARLKLGPKEPLAERADFGVLDDVTLTAASLSGDMAYLQFSALYWAILGFGGYVADDESFAEGDGIRWWMSFPDGNDTNEIEYTRALLRINSDGSKWWRAEFESEGELSEFEYLVDKSGGLVTLRYEDPGTNEVVSYEPSDPDAWWGGYSASVKDREDLDALSEGTERMRVPAGTFTADKVVAGEPPYQYMWWYTDEVPGLLVKLEAYEDDILIVEGELRDVLSGVTTPWDEPW